MNTLTGFNTAEQIIAGLYNTSTFQSYKPGFNTIKINREQFLIEYTLYKK